MQRNLFKNFSKELLMSGADGAHLSTYELGNEGRYSLRYIPFEFVNKEAKLVIVGITPGNTQISLAYQTAQQFLKAGRDEEDILKEVKKAGAFGGPSMRPNLLKLLRHFHFERILKIDCVESLWGSNSKLLHSTSVIPHAAYKSGKMFSGSFDEVLGSKLLRECFLDCFVPSVKEIDPDALYVGLGPCPQAALEWCVKSGNLNPKQVLGAFCHPSNSGGSTTRYYIREVTLEGLVSKDPVRNRTDWLDRAYQQMQANTASILVSLPANSVCHQKDNNPADS